MLPLGTSPETRPKTMLRLPPFTIRLGCAASAMDPAFLRSANDGCETPSGDSPANKCFWEDFGRLHAEEFKIPNIKMKRHRENVFLKVTKQSTHIKHQQKKLSAEGNSLPELLCGTFTHPPPTIPHHLEAIVAFYGDITPFLIPALSEELTARVG